MTHPSALCGLVVVAAIGTAGASVPVGVYAVIDRAVLTPAAGPPKSVRLEGAFVVWDSRPGVGYRAPDRGHLYFRCPDAQLDACRNEWRDLASLAGTGETVGFGSRALENGRVRRAGDPASAPDPYPIQFGVVRLGAPRGGLFTELRNLAKER